MSKCEECGLPIDECSARAVASKILGDAAKDPNEHDLLTITIDLCDEIQQLRDRIKVLEDAVRQGDPCLFK